MFYKNKLVTWFVRTIYSSKINTNAIKKHTRRTETIEDPERPVLLRVSIDQGDVVVGIGQLEVIECDPEGRVWGALDDPATVEVSAVVTRVTGAGDVRRHVDRIALGTLCRNEQ